MAQSVALLTDLQPSQGEPLGIDHDPLLSETDPSPRIRPVNTIRS